MSYDEWVKAHLEKLETILLNIKDLKIEDVVSYFEYDNLAHTNIEFCPLYRTFTKCHSKDKLNCLLCACPYFEYSEDKPILTTLEGKKVMSICKINSKNKKSFEVDNVVHCDCSDCVVPHTNSFIYRQIESNNIKDSISLLEMIRAFQLGDILGKYKVF